MAVRSYPMPDKEPPKVEKKPQRPRVGFLRPGHIERAFILGLYSAIVALVVLSILGTFYGWRSLPAPITHPAQMWRDVWADSAMFWIAVAIQIALSLAQYGARQMARHDPRWWILYLVALAISVYYNVQAYWAPLSDLMPAYAVLPFLIAVDAVPEFMAVRHE